MVSGDDVAGECDAGSPGSGGASPYLRRAFPRQPATYLRDRHEISVSNISCIWTNCIIPFSVERVGTNIYFFNLFFLIPWLLAERRAVQHASLVEQGRVCTFDPWNSLCRELKRAFSCCYFAPVGARFRTEARVAQAG
jgi:hypothetical protein